MKKKRSRSRRRSGFAGRARGIGGKARSVLKSSWVQKGMMGIGGATVGGLIGNALAGDQGAVIGKVGGAVLTGGFEGVVADQLLSLATGQPTVLAMLGGLGGGNGGNGGDML